MAATSAFTTLPRVLITGIGLATGLGPTRESSWYALLQGRCALRPLLELGPTNPARPWYGATIPSEIRSGFAPEFAWMDRLAAEAIADASAETLLDSDRLGVVVGLSKGWVPGLTAHAVSCQSSGDCEPSRGDWIRFWPNGAAAQLAAVLRARGPALAPIAACATGLVAVLRGFDLIQSGVCDAVLAGSVDASLHPMMLGAFDRMGVLAKVDPSDPESAIRPCDRHRTGFLPSEGGALFLLERAGLRPHLGNYAIELRGGALGADAHHITGLKSDPDTLAQLIDESLINSRCHSDEIGHVNLHATATLVNDPVECQAVRRAFGSRSDQLFATANKAQIGHALGAAGAVELAFTCLALRDRIIPPTRNRNDPDPDCNLRFASTATAVPDLQAALKLSLGFGGHLAAVVVAQSQYHGGQP